MLNTENLNYYTKDEADERFVLKTPRVIPVLCNGNADHLKIQKIIDLVTDTSVPTTIVPIGKCVIHGMIKLKEKMTLNGELCTITYDCSKMSGVSDTNGILQAVNSRIINCDFQSNDVNYAFTCLIGGKSNSVIENCSFSNFKSSAPGNTAFIYANYCDILNCNFNNCVANYGDFIKCDIGKCRGNRFENITVNPIYSLISANSSDVIENNFKQIKDGRIITADYSNVTYNTIMSYKCLIANGHGCLINGGEYSVLVGNRIDSVRVNPQSSLTLFAVNSNSTFEDNLITDVSLDTSTGSTEPVTTNIIGIKTYGNGNKLSNNLYINELNTSEFNSEIGLKADGIANVICGNSARFRSTSATIIPYKIAGSKNIVKNNITNLASVGEIAGIGTIAADNIAIGEVING